MKPSPSIELRQCLVEPEGEQVTWGPQTTDEMCIAFIAYTLDSEHLTRAVRSDSPLDEHWPPTKGGDA